ncbi:hypothetical protein UFOVP433_6 [uncultured Caudovirales phage]|uniref:Uncharacterized protein n=1 Tax=uncultured Caudovirales phage TaxID=2100421 RepID=A0A6J5MF68_9CAUD|nr:hypothetical protein UFOVP433_6 [uncultured Caudovirales phage]CAB4158410.1 hypothetical protein UFOVP702_9 [uncultured Caudovirales phage]
MNEKLLAVFAEYIRAVAVAVLTLVASGNMDPRSMAIGAAASLLPLLARGANPKDSAFGRTGEPNA